MRCPGPESSTCFPFSWGGSGSLPLQPTLPGSPQPRFVLRRPLPAQAETLSSDAELDQEGDFYLHSLMDDQPRLLGCTSAGLSAGTRYHEGLAGKCQPWAHRG
ncbi:unnamed protein product [Lepidochelys olivacea]